MVRHGGLKKKIKALREDSEPSHDVDMLGHSSWSVLQRSQTASHWPGCRDDSEFLVSLLRPLVAELGAAERGWAGYRGQLVGRDS